MRREVGGGGVSYLAWQPFSKDDPGKRISILQEAYAYVAVF
jgi:hypothetical protein